MAIKEDFHYEDRIDTEELRIGFLGRRSYGDYIIYSDGKIFTITGDISDVTKTITKKGLEGKQATIIASFSVPKETEETKFAVERM